VVVLANGKAVVIRRRLRNDRVKRSLVNEELLPSAAWYGTADQSFKIGLTSASGGDLLGDLLCNVLIKEMILHHVTF
jgi:hypothetical protein